MVSRGGVFARPFHRTSLSAEGQKPDSAFRFQSEVDRGRKQIIGVNAFVEPDDLSIPTLEIDDQIESSQLESLAKVKKSRDPQLVAEALARVRQTAASDQNIMPALLHAAEQHVSLGEMVQAMGETFGRYQQGGGI